jgi:hypothetical protein
MTYYGKIAGNQFSQAFDSTRDFDNPDSALRSIKARNKKDWRDCFVWVVCVDSIGNVRNMVKYEDKEWRSI